MREPIYHIPDYILALMSLIIEDRDTDYLREIIYPLTIVTLSIHGYIDTVDKGKYKIAEKGIKQLDDWFKRNKFTNHPVVI